MLVCLPSGQEIKKKKKRKKSVTNVYMNKHVLKSLLNVNSRANGRAE